jgi:hypothetical protein
MPNEPFNPDDAPRFRPPDWQTQEEVGGVLERAFQRERGRVEDEEEVRRLHAMADDAAREAEMKLSKAREAEAAMAGAVERFGLSDDPAHLAEISRWREESESYKREAERLKLHAEQLRLRVG